MTVLEKVKNSDKQDQKKSKGKIKTLKLPFISQPVSVLVYNLPTFLLNQRIFKVGLFYVFISFLFFCLLCYKLLSMSLSVLQTHL